MSSISTQVPHSTANLSGGRSTPFPDQAFEQSTHAAPCCECRCHTETMPTEPAHRAHHDAEQTTPVPHNDASSAETNDSSPSTRRKQIIKALGMAAPVLLGVASAIMERRQESQRDRRHEDNRQRRAHRAPQYDEDRYRSSRSPSPCFERGYRYGIDSSPYYERPARYERSPSPYEPKHSRHGRGSSYF